jgi:hypothetical protein
MMKHLQENESLFWTLFLYGYIWPVQINLLEVNHQQDATQLRNLLFHLRQ